VYSEEVLPIYLAGNTGKRKHKDGKRNSLKDANLSGYIPFIYLQW